MTSQERERLIREVQERVLRDNLSAFSSVEKMEKFLKKMYRQSGKEIQRLISEMMANVNEWSWGEMAKYDRLTLLMSQINREIMNLGGREIRYVETELGTRYIDSYMREVYLLGSYINVSYDLSLLSPDRVKEAVNYPWSGDMFSDRIWDNKSKLVKNVREGITQSLILGESMRKTADRINQGIDNSLFNALRVARTEMMRVSYVGERKAMEQHDIRKVEYLATTSDERTCEICGRTHGRIFTLGGEIGLPRHPHCRCTYAPVFDYVVEDDLNPVTESIRESRNFESWDESNGVTSSVRRNWQTANGVG